MWKAAPGHVPKPCVHSSVASCLIHTLLFPSPQVSSLNEVEQLRVCEICHQKLIDFHSFRSLCVAAHTKLSQVWIDRSVYAIFCVRHYGFTFIVSFYIPPQDHEELSKLCIVKLDEAEFPTDCPGEDGNDVLADNDASFEEPSLVIEPITSVVVKEEPDAHEYDEERPQDSASEEEFVPPEPKRRGRKKLVTKEKSAPVTRRVELACHLCDDKFRTQNRLDGHLRMHQGLKPALCKECGKEFAGWRSLRRHMKEKHLKLDIGYFPCDYEGCTYSYTTRKVLLQHKKKHEPGWVKPVPKKCVCETCGKTFSSAGSLKVRTIFILGLKFVSYLLLSCVTETYTHPHGRATVPVRNLRQAVLHRVQAEGARDAPPGHQELRVYLLRAEENHPGRAEAAHELPHQGEGAEM